MNTDTDDINPMFLKVIVAIAFLAVVFVLTMYFINFSGDISKDQNKWGLFGDFIGGSLNPILAFLSLIALLFTIILQSNELKATRIELKRAAIAQEESSKAILEQNRVFLTQSFENKFFSLLDEHNKALDKLTIPNGRWGEDKSNFDIVKQNIFSSKNTAMFTARNALQKQNILCGSYFRILYHLLKFIVSNHPNCKNDYTGILNTVDHPVSESEKSYSNIVRAFVDQAVLQVLFINCYTQNPESTYWKYRLLVERYAFFEHMPFTIENSNSDILKKNITAYKLKAYGDNNSAKALYGAKA